MATCPALSHFSVILRMALLRINWLSVILVNEPVPQIHEDGSIGSLSGLGFVLGKAWHLPICLFAPQKVLAEI